MDWVAIKPALIALFASLSGLKTVWRDKSRPYVPNGPDKAICLLAISPAGGQGFDERRQEDDYTQALNEELQDNAVGIRNITLSIRVESYDQSDDKTALHYLELVRSRLRWRTTTKALNIINVAFRGTRDVTDLSAMRDQRIASLANLDIKLGAVSIERDPARYGYIETTDPLTVSKS